VADAITSRVRAFPCLAPQLAVPLLAVVAWWVPAAAQRTSTSNADWPGLWGPTRNGIAAPGSRVTTRMKVAWRKPVEGGYGEVAVRGPRAYALVLQAGEDFVVSMDAADGRERWRARIGRTYRGHGGSDDGPIGTPTVEGGQVFVVGPHGTLVALTEENGREQWRHELTALGAGPPDWGFATAPLVVDDKVIVQAAGASGPGVIAFDRTTGTVAWRAPAGTRPGYASPVLSRGRKTREILVATGDRVAALSADDGAERWGVEGPGDPNAVGNSPIPMPDGRVLLTFWPEAWMLQVSGAVARPSVRRIWQSARLRGSYGPTMFVEGQLYGFSGQFLVCLDAATGEERWRQRLGEGALIGVGEDLVLLGQTSGEVRIARVSPKGYQERASQRVLEAGVRAVTGPSFAGGRLFVRNLREIVALEFME
jgi:outer membrane protein assembly factor BamB